MDDDHTILPTFAGVIDLLEKQEIDLSSAEGGHLPTWMPA